MQAHGGGVMEWNGKYYWYGEDKSGETYRHWSLMCAPLTCAVLHLTQQQMKWTA